MAIRPIPSNGATPERSGKWYRQGIVWLGCAVFAASIAGCIWLIGIAQRYADPPLPVSGPQIMKVPIAKPPRAPGASR